jgi:SAM-dependent methyltransferase
VIETALERLYTLARVLTNESIQQYGTSPEQAEALIPHLVDLGTNDDLFDRMEQLLGGIGYFGYRRKILEIGCGTGPFVHSALARAHDAYGIDNDRNRLAVASEKIEAYGLPPEWKERTLYGDATGLSFESNSFDVVLGWQVIEHVPNLQATLFEAVRVTKPGGLLFFWAPDYRAPYEAHYAMPYPPFASPHIARAWVTAMERPIEGLNTFVGITLPQVHAILDALGCRVFAAGIDRPIDNGASKQIDVSSSERLQQSAKFVRDALASGTLAPQLCSPTSLTIAAQKI